MWSQRRQIFKGSGWHKNQGEHKDSEKVTEFRNWVKLILLRSFVKLLETIPGDKWNHMKMETKLLTHTHTHTHICPNHAACEENDQNKGKQTYLKHTWSSILKAWTTDYTYLKTHIS